MAGENYPLDDASILAICAPRNSVGGPYTVVYKNTDERYAIVALDWNGTPSLGIRWFWGNGGSPFSSGHAIWFIYPSELLPGLLKSLPIDYVLRRKLKNYLSGTQAGKDLF